MLPIHHDESETVLSKAKSHILSFIPTTLTAIAWKFMLILGVLVYGTYGVLVHLCQVDGVVPFSSAAAVLITEIGKFIISSTLYVTTVKKEDKSIPGIHYILALSVPALLYTINNNIAVHMQMHMDPTTYQVLGNMKTATTAILYRIIMKRTLTQEKWIAISLLFFAGIFDSYGGYIPSKASVTPTESGIGFGSIIYITMSGLMMMVPYCFISGFAGVYTEYVLKSQYHHSIHLQNAILYTFGIALNLITWLSQSRANTQDYNIFRGFSTYTWILISTQIVSGLITGAVMKHGSNITRLFIISCAMLEATVLSVLVFHTHLSYHFIVSAFMVVIAFSLYHYRSVMPLPKAE